MRTHQRALAGAVRPQHGDEFAVRDRQADVVQRLDAPVARRELPDLEDGASLHDYDLPADDGREQEAG